MDVLPKISTIEITINQDFVSAYQKAIDSLWLDMPALENPESSPPKNSYVKLKAKTIVLGDEPYDLIISEIQGFKTVYLETIGSWERERSLLQRHSQTLTFIRDTSPDRPEIYTLSKVSRETGVIFDYFNKVLDTLNDISGLESEVLKAILANKSFEYHEPKVKDTSLDYFTQFLSSSKKMQLFIHYLVNENLLGSEYKDIFADLNKQVHPQVYPYIDQLLVHYNYLKEQAIENRLNNNNRFYYNDDDYKIYMSDYGNLVVEDQNIYFEFFVNDNEIKVVGLLLETTEDNYSKDNRQSNEITIHVKNGIIEQVDPVMFECLIMDLHGAVEEMGREEYPEIEYPVDINDIEYQKAYWQSKGFSEKDAIIKIFLCSKYNKNKESLDFSGVRYLDYMHIPEYTPTEYEGTCIPLFYFDQLISNFEYRIKDLNPEYVKLLKAITDDIKGSYDFGGPDTNPSSTKLFPKLGLGTFEDREKKRKEILQTIQQWNEKYNKSNLSLSF